MSRIAPTVLVQGLDGGAVVIMDDHSMAEVVIEPDAVPRLIAALQHLAPTAVAS